MPPASSTSLTTSTPSSTECRLAARRAIGVLRRQQRRTAERAMGAAPEQEMRGNESESALEQLAMYHLRSIAAELEDEVRAYLGGGAIKPNGVLSFLAPDGRADGVSVEDVLRSARATAEGRLGAIRQLDAPHPSAPVRVPSREHAEPAVYGSRHDEEKPARMNETFTIPKMEGFGDIREFSEQMSARAPGPFHADYEYVRRESKRVTILQEGSDDERRSSDDDEVPVVTLSTMSTPSSVKQVVQQLHSELATDRSFVAAFRSGDADTTRREVERRLRERAVLEIEEEEEEVYRPSASMKRHDDVDAHPPLPLLHSTPLRRRRPDEKQMITSSMRTRLREEEWRKEEKENEGRQTVDIGVGTTNGAAEPPAQVCASVQCSLEDPHDVSQASSHAVSISTNGSSSFGQVPQRLLVEHMSGSTPLRIVNVRPEDMVGVDETPSTLYTMYTGAGGYRPTPAPRSSSSLSRPASADEKTPLASRAVFRVMEVDISSTSTDSRSVTTATTPTPLTPRALAPSPRPRTKIEAARGTNETGSEKKLEAPVLVPGRDSLPISSPDSLIERLDRVNIGPATVPQPLGTVPPASTVLQQSTVLLPDLTTAPTVVPSVPTSSPDVANVPVPVGVPTAQAPASSPSVPTPPPRRLQMYPSSSSSIEEEEGEDTLEHLSPIRES